MANGTDPVVPTTVVTAPIAVTKISALQAASHPLAILVLATGVSISLIIVAVGSLLARVDSDVLLSIFSTFLGTLGGVMGGMAMGRAQAQRTTDVVTTTTTGTGTGTPGPSGSSGGG